MLVVDENLTLNAAVDDLGPAVRGDHLQRRIDVLAELRVDVVGFDPRQDLTLARGVGDPPDVLTTDVAVFVVRAGAPFLAAVNGVHPAVFSDNGVDVAALRQNGHTFG